MRAGIAFSPAQAAYKYIAIASVQPLGNMTPCYSLNRKFKKIYKKYRIGNVIFHPIIFTTALFNTFVAMIPEAARITCVTLAWAAFKD